MFKHVPVLLEESISAINSRPTEVIVDCTGGGGGHSQKFVESLGDNGKLVCIDRDSAAVENLRARFKPEITSGKLNVVHGNFGSIHRILEDLGLVGKVGAIFADLGVSSPQLDEAHRGFSFSSDGPLDMRMNQDEGVPLSEILCTLDSKEITSILREYGEEPKARQIANAIARRTEQSKIETTGELANLIESEVKYKTPSRKHPATRSFQAFRIYMNREFEELRTLLDHCLDLLCDGGVAAFITFHSLEDRIVKTKMKDWSVSDIVKLRLPVTESGAGGRVRICKPFPTVPTAAEITNNPRARSAKLRVCTKIPAAM